MSTRCINFNELGQHLRKIRVSIRTSLDFSKFLFNSMRKKCINTFHLHCNSLLVASAFGKYNEFNCNQFLNVSLKCQILPVKHTVDRWFRLFDSCDRLAIIVLNVLSSIMKLLWSEKIIVSLRNSLKLDIAFAKRIFLTNPLNLLIIVLKSYYCSSFFVHRIIKVQVNTLVFLITRNIVCDLLWHFSQIKPMGFIHHYKKCRGITSHEESTQFFLSIKRNQFNHEFEKRTNTKYKSQTNYRVFSLIYCHWGLISQFNTWIISE